MSPNPLSAGPIERLLNIMARLRDVRAGCPWDIEQTFTSIAPHTIEEAYEVADAIARGDLAGLKEELGDLLLQVVFHAQMAKEQGDFEFADVVEAISEKLIRRHPHIFARDVFASARVDTSAAQTAAWEDHKAAERVARAEIAEGRTPGADPRSGGALHGVAMALPALTRAVKLQARAARVGFDWPDVASALPKIAEEAGELAREVASGADHDRLEDELGDLLFACANVARKLNIDPEAALRRAGRKFERRFANIEALLAADGRTPDSADLAELEGLWVKTKASE